MYQLKDFKTIYRCNNNSAPSADKEEIREIAEQVLNHIIESNCYNDVEELDLSALTLVIDPEADSIALFSGEDSQPLYPAEKISIWKKFLGR